MQFTTNKPYLLRAIYEWILDNGGTPHIVLYADNPNVSVPLQYIENGKIVLNISPTASQNLLIDNDGVSFSARFGGKPFSIYSPIGAVLALYASENNEGLSFDPEDEVPPPDSPKLESVSGNSKKKKSGKRPTLKVVK